MRVYVNSDLPVATDVGGLIPWDRAQAPFHGLSRKFGDLVQGMLAQRFKGSPSAAQTAAVRQLRTTAAPAIAVEISSVVVEDRAELDRMAPGVADCDRDAALRRSGPRTWCRQLRQERCRDAALDQMLVIGGLLRGGARAERFTFRFCGGGANCRKAATAN